MKYIFILGVVCTFLFSFEIMQCKEYQKQSNNIIGSSPSINMMIQTLKSYEFPQKISKQDAMFKKLSSIESLVEQKVDLVVLWNSKADYSNLASKLAKVGIDSCSLDLSSLEKYIEAYTVLGKIMNQQSRANILSNHIKEKKKSIDALKTSIKQEEKLSVYYARGEDGLESECEGSIHAEAIDIIGAKNPLQCNSFKNMRININYETLLLLNPDVIITSSKNFLEKAFSSQKYAYLNAVKNKRVYLIPNKPINWLDNPPSFFKILGVYWLSEKVYPNLYRFDIEKEKKEFFNLFLNRRDSE
jgi:iron complex transport system substrate-binding protein